MKSSFRVTDASGRLEGDAYDGMATLSPTTSNGAAVRLGRLIPWDMDHRELYVDTSSEST